MFPGKKAFDRLTWAFKNVLNASLAWLFHDLRSPLLPSQESESNGQATPNALTPHAPTIKTIKPTPTPLHQALLPPFIKQQAEASESATPETQHDRATDLLEWLSLAMARSPRVLNGDSIDPYLSRYAPAETTGGVPTDLVLYQWHGFAPAAFVVKILLAATKASVGGEGWFALGGESFGGNGYMVLRDGGEVVTWNYSG